MKMLYEIIKTAKSSDNLICYFLYKQNIDSENISADSYGVCAADLFEIFSVNDVLTDHEKAQVLLSEIAENSVSVNRLEDFITDYIDEM